MPDKNTLKDLNLQTELINNSGCYKDKPNEITYCITSQNISKKILIKILNACAKDPYRKYTNKLSSFDLYNYLEAKIYDEPLFNRNFALVNFPYKKKEDNKPQTARFFRYHDDYKADDLFIELREKYHVLSKENISFNEALFVLYGFNCQLVPDYDIRRSSNAIDKALINSKQGEMLIGLYTDHNFKQKNEFINFALVNKFIKPTENIKTIKDIEKKTDSTNSNHSGEDNDRVYPDWLSNGLHKGLLKHGLIHGKYDSMWEWLPYKNTLAYLADELSSKFKTECPIERKQPNLTAYIKYSGTKFHKVSESKDYKTRDKIDIVISILKELKPKP